MTAATFTLSANPIQAHQSLAAKRTGLVKPGHMYRSHATRQELAQLDLFEGVA